jgi:hypothetical protein
MWTDFNFLTNACVWLCAKTVWILAHGLLWYRCECARIDFYMNRWTEKNWTGERCECYIYLLDVKKNFYYISVSVQTKKKIYIYIYICACACKRENDAHFSVQLCMFREKKLYIYLYERECEKNFEHLFSVNYYYFNADIVCINPIDYANNHFFYFACNGKIYCQESTDSFPLFLLYIFYPVFNSTRKFNFLLRKRLVAKDSQWIHDSAATSILQRLKSSPFRLSIWHQTVW